MALGKEDVGDRWFLTAHRTRFAPMRVPNIGDVSAVDLARPRAGPTEASRDKGIAALHARTLRRMVLLRLGYESQRI
jgi:hypothetical protein